MITGPSRRRLNQPVLTVRKTPLLGVMERTDAQHWEERAMDAAKKDTCRQRVSLKQVELAVSLSEILLRQDGFTQGLPARVDHPEAEGAWVHPGAAEMVECS